MKNVLKASLLVAVLALSAGVAAQDKKTDDAKGVAGTWDMNAMSHQMALVLEQDGTKVTGTLMIMGKDAPVAGEFVDGKLSLTGSAMLKTPSHDGQPEGPGTPLKLTGTLKDDGTLEGEMPMPQGAVKWTAERLKKKTQQ